MMCFSAEVSFGTAAVLGVAGTVSLSRVTQKRQLAFAALPLLFAIQQACEGILWLSLAHDTAVQIQKPFTYLFLLFAQVLWTSWVPLCILLLETNRRRRRLLYITLIAGICDSLLLGYRLLFYSVSAEISCNHIDYQIGTTGWMVILSSFFYVVAVVLPPFISGNNEIRLMGVLLTCSLIVSKFAYDNYLISVWCFFAAAISVMVAHIMKGFNSAKIPGTV